MESTWETPTKRPRYTQPPPVYTYNPLQGAVYTKPPSPPPGLHDGSDLGSCASAIKSALDLFSDDSLAEEMGVDAVQAVWRNNYENALAPTNAMQQQRLPIAQQYTTGLPPTSEFIAPHPPQVSTTTQYMPAMQQRVYPGYNNTPPNLVKPSVGASQFGSDRQPPYNEAYIHAAPINANTIPATMNNTQYNNGGQVVATSVATAHPVISKMEQRFASGNKNALSNDYLQNYQPYPSGMQTGMPSGFPNNTAGNPSQNNINTANAPHIKTESPNNATNNNEEPMIPKAPPSLPSAMAQSIMDLVREQSRELDEMSFTDPVTHIYNPMNYAWAAHEMFIRRYCNSPKKILFLGMNPGPYGMAQTGVPFGEVNVTRDWLRITAEIGKPASEHPKRPVLGFACSKKEVSGARFWGYFKRHCREPEVFFNHAFIYNACPLLFVMKSGKNVTPADLPAAQRKPLMKLCDLYLAKLVKILGCETVVGIGKFAADHTGVVLRENSIRGVRVVRIMHPSPANPVANREWEPRVTGELVESGIWDIVTNGTPPPVDYDNHGNPHNLITSPDTTNSNSNSSSISNGSSSIPQGTGNIGSEFSQQQQTAMMPQQQMLPQQQGLLQQGLQHHMGPAGMMASSGQSNMAHCAGPNMGPTGPGVGLGANQLGHLDPMGSMAMMGQNIGLSNSNMGLHGPRMGPGAGPGMNPSAAIGSPLGSPIGSPSPGIDAGNNALSTPNMSSSNNITFTSNVTSTVNGQSLPLSKN